MDEFRAEKRAAMVWALVVFDGPPSAPNFEVEVRAQRLLPDMFYVNEFAHRLSKHNREMFNELFA